MTSTLYRHGVVHSPADPFAEAILVEDGTVAWLGADDTADGLAERADEVVDLRGGLLTPGFVDAHVHVLDTALADEGIDLRAAGSVGEVLDAVAAAVARRPASRADEPLIGFGWDESGWPQRRPPTAAELDQVAPGVMVHLGRVDGHSAVVSSALALAARLAEVPGWAGDGTVHGAARDAALDLARSAAYRRSDELYRAALRAAARRGIVAVHEMSAPHLDTRAGLRRLMSLAADDDERLPLVSGYRGELCVTVDDAREVLTDVPGLTGIGGDLSVDGSIGSRSAALRDPYADGPGQCGTLHLHAEQVANHVAATTRAGTQGGFHVIGDGALDEVVLGLRAAADVEGPAAVAAAGHRLEHAEMVDARALAALVLLGVRLSVQPAFDAAWGGPDGMYARRLGAARASTLNPLADLAAAGIPLAFGSDSPITPLDPWAGVAAAIHHHSADQRLGARAAFRAATRGGWRLAGHDESGELRVGSPAHLAVWEVEELAVQAVDGRLSAWSPEARSGVPLLPALGPGTTPPKCLHTRRGSVVLFDELQG